MSMQEKELQIAIFWRRICLLITILGIMSYIFNLSLNIYLENVREIENERRIMQIALISAKHLDKLDFLANKKIEIEVKKTTLSIDVFKDLIDEINRLSNSENKISENSNFILKSLRKFVKTDNLAILSIGYISFNLIFLTLFAVFDTRVRNLLSYILENERSAYAVNLLKQNSTSDYTDALNSIILQHMSYSILKKTETVGI